MHEMHQNAPFPSIKIKKNVQGWGTVRPRPILIWKGKPSPQTTPHSFLPLPRSTTFENVDTPVISLKR